MSVELRECRRVPGVTEEGVRHVQASATRQEVEAEWRDIIFSSRQKLSRQGVIRVIFAPRWRKKKKKRARYLRRTIDSRYFIPWRRQSEEGVKK